MLQAGGATGSRHQLTVTPSLTRAFWSKAFVRPGNTVQLQAQFQNIPDGTSVVVNVTAICSTQAVVPKSPPTEGSVEQGRCLFDWYAQVDGIADEDMPLTAFMFTIGVPDLGIEGTCLQPLTVGAFGALIESIDRTFCPGVESLHVKYSIADPTNFVRAGLLRVFGNHYQDASYPDPECVVYQRLLSPEELRSGRHELTWQGFTNAAQGPLAIDESCPRYVTPLFSPYIVDILLLDRACDDANAWPDDALPSMPHPTLFSGLGLAAAGSNTEIAEPDEPATHAAFEVVVGGLDLEHGEWAPDGEIDGRTALAQLQLNELGYFSGPVDDVVGPLTQAALLEFKRNHWEVDPHPEIPGTFVPNPSRPLGHAKANALEADLDEATWRALAAQETPRNYLSPELNPDLSPELPPKQPSELSEETSSHPNQIPNRNAAARVFVDGTVFFQEASEFFDPATEKAGVSKPEREKQWMPRPWIPVVARPRLLDREGRLASADQSKFGSAGLRILWRVIDPPESHDGLGFPHDKFTDLVQAEHEVRVVAVDSIDTLAGVQQRLTRMGYDCGGETTLGSATQKAVEDFQSDEGISEDGLGDNTRTAIDSRHGPLHTQTLQEIAEPHGLDKFALMNDPKNADLSEIDDWQIPVGTTVFVPPFAGFSEYVLHKEGLPEVYVDAVVKSLSGDEGPQGWAADNAPAQVSDGPMYGTRDENHRGVSALRHGDDLFHLLPWSAEEVDDEELGRGQVLAVPTPESGPARGASGVFFVPSILAGDNYQLQARIDWTKDGQANELGNTPWLEQRYADVPALVQSGVMTVWRAVEVAEVLHAGLDPENGAGAEPVNWPRLKDIFRPAYVDLRLPPKAAHRDLSQQEYCDVVGEAYSIDPQTVTFDPSEFYPSQTLPLPVQEDDEEPNAYLTRVKRAAKDFHDKFAQVATRRLRQRRRQGAVIITVARNLKPMPVHRGDEHKTALPMSVVRERLDSFSMSSSLAEGVVVIDRSSPMQTHTTIAHELGHALWLTHYRNTHDGQPHLTDHDNGDLYCVMNYPTKNERPLIDPDFCGKCLMKLRGWNEQLLPGDDSEAQTHGAAAPAKKNSMMVAFALEGQLDTDYPAYILESTDGSYHQRRTVRDDLQPGDGFLQIEFDQMLEGKQYTLTRELSETQIEEVFTEVPFGTLMDQTRESSDRHYNRVDTAALTDSENSAPAPGFDDAEPGDQP